MMQKVSQSFIKAMRDYNQGEECGLLIKHQYVDGNLIDRESDSMALGAYFEFCLSGALPKSGKQPIPETNKDGKLSMDYKRAKINAERVKDMIQEMGLSIVSAGKKLDKGRFEGTLDLICEVILEDNHFGLALGTLIVIDLKYSGLIEDKWSKHGWELSVNQAAKKYHTTQAIQYHFVSGMPFYFLVTGNKNLEKDGVFAPTVSRIFKIDVTDLMIEEHIAEANTLQEQLAFESEFGFTPRPEMERCRECPLSADCEFKQVFPKIEVI